MQQLSTALKSYLLLSATYLLLVLLLPANHAAQKNYNLTSTAYHLLVFMVVIPLIGIWFGAFYSYGRLRQYSQAVADTPEGEDIAKLTTGFTWLAWGSVLTAILSFILNTIGDQHHGFYASAIVITNYASLLVPIFAYSLISSATRGMITRARIFITSGGTKLLISSFMLIGVLYCFMCFRHLDMQILSSSNNPYFIPTWLVVLTLIVPYLYSWFIGLLAAYELFLFSQKVSGLLYQQAMRMLSFGVMAVIASSIAVQYLRSATPRIGHLSLNTTLLIINLIYIFMAAGYIFISLGARKLRKIEEV